MYFSAWHRTISLICMTTFLLLLYGWKLKTAMPLLVFTYLQMYLIDLTELLYSTFKRAFYVFDCKAESGIIHELSASMKSFRICIVDNLLPSSAVLLYKGYQLFPGTVLDANARGTVKNMFRSSCVVNLESMYCKIHVSYFYHNFMHSLSTLASDIYYVYLLFRCI